MFNRINYLSPLESDHSVGMAGIQLYMIIYKILLIISNKAFKEGIFNDPQLNKPRQFTVLK